jgi:hypothetical protein
MASSNKKSRLRMYSLMFCHLCPVRDMEHWVMTLENDPNR